LLTVSRSFMNIANSVWWRMEIILKANDVNLFVSSVLFAFWYHSPKCLDTSRISSGRHSCQFVVSVHRPARSLCGYILLITSWVVFISQQKPRVAESQVLAENVRRCVRLCA
jgi:hypothetical protein